MKKVKIRILQLGIYIKYLALLGYCLVFHVNHDDIWLISERGDEARDNGFAFYRYLKKNHPEVKVKYILSKKSKDLNKIEKNDLVYFRSIKHYIYFITSKCLISAHIMGFSPEFRVFSKLDKYNLVKTKGIKVFLQHGIILNKLPEHFITNSHIDIFISGAKREYEFLKNKENISSDILKLTGLARYDYFDDQIENIVLLMPTWRNYLFYESIDSFIESEYYQKWNSLINNQELSNLLKRANLKLIFYPHYEIQKFISSFKTSNKNIILANHMDYDISELIKKAKCLITDYTSVHFDFAYQKKPIIYYQFDKNDFFKKHYKPGYFRYEKDGFGPVVFKENDVIKEMENIIKNQFVCPKDVMEKISNFYSFNDKKNCERIYQEIIKKLE